MAEKSEAKTMQRKAPYVAASILWQYLNKLRFVATPTHLDAKELEEYGISKSWSYHLLSTLKFLNLVEKNGKTTPALRSLQTMGDEFQRNLEEVVRNAYSDLFLKVDPAIDSRANITNFFMKHYSPASAESATTLFLDLCKEAGIPVSEEAKREKAKPTAEVKRKLSKAKTEIRVSDTASIVNATGLREVYARKLIESDLDVAIGPGMDAEAIKAAQEVLRERHEAIKEVLEQLDHKKKESKDIGN